MGTEAPSTEGFPGLTRIPGGQRLLLGVLGLGLAGFGEYAVFTEIDSSTSTALGVGGVVVLLLAVLGVLPSRVKIGDAELEFRAAASEVADSIARSVPQDQLVNIAQAAQADPISTESAAARLIAQRLGEHASFYEAVSTALQQAAPVLDATLEWNTDDVTGWSVVVTRAEAQLWIGISLRLDQLLVDRVLATPHTIADHQRSLLVVEEVDPGAAGRLGGARPMAWLEWTGNADVLRETIRNLLAVD